MSYHIRLQELKKDIRREQLHDLFAQKRLLIIENYSNQSPFEANTYLTLQDLKSISAASQIEHQIQQLRSQGCITRLEPFLAPQFGASLEQFYASSAYCNLLLVAEKQPPSLKVTRNLIKILETNNINTIGNVICIIFNVIYDHPEWANYLINQLAFAQKLRRLLELEGTSQQFIVDLLRTVHIVLSSARKDACLLALSGSIVNLAAQNNSEIIYPALRSLNWLLKMFPEKITQQIIQNRLIPKLGEMIKYSPQMKILQTYLHIANAICHKLSSKEFQTQLLPIIRNNRNHSRKLLIHSYRVLYTALQTSVFAASQYWKDPMRQQMLQQFQETIDQQILIELIYIFSLCLLNLPLNNADSTRLKSHLYRASKIISDNVQMQGFIDETIHMHKSLYQ